MWVDPAPEAVKAGVDHFVQNPIERDWVRHRVLEKVSEKRGCFLKVLNHHLSARGQPDTSYDYIWGGDRGILDRYTPILGSP